MKLTAHILLIWICLLNTTPAIVNLGVMAANKEECKESCCEEESTCPADEKQKPDCSDNCCDNGICAPCTCCICCFYIPEKVLDLGIPGKNRKDIPVVHENEIANSAYQSNTWHPPKNV
jgi:hypothetical protein